MTSVRYVVVSLIIPRLELKARHLQNKLFFVGNITLYNENNNTPASAVVSFIPLFPETDKN